MDGSDRTDYASADFVALFYELFRGTSDPVFIVRLADGTIIDANDSLLRLTGYERAQVIRHSLSGIPAWAPSLPWWTTFIADLRDHGRIEDRPSIVRASSGREHDMWVTAVAVRWRGEDVAMGIGRLIRSS